MSSNLALHVSTYSGAYRFEEQAGEWRQTRRALTYFNLTCLSADRENPQLLYAGTEHSGLFVTEDGGAQWKRAAPNTPKLMLYSVLALPDSVAVGTIPAAVYRRKFDGTWEECEGVRLSSKHANFPPSPDLQSRARYIAIDPAVPERLYVGIEVGGILLSDDGGRTWKAANDGLTDLDIHCILPCEISPKLVLAVCGDSVFRSPDRAGHWEEVTPPHHDYGTAAAEDGSGMIYLGSARGRPTSWLREERADAAIYRSRDAGMHWEPVIERLSGAVLSMCRNPNGSGVLAGTSEGELIAVDASGARVLTKGLPCITGLAVGA